MFGRFRRDRSTVVRLDDSAQEAAKLVEALHAGKTLTDTVSGAVVNASCNATITIGCLQQLYSAVGYKPSAKLDNSIGITGYLEQFANIQDLQSFYANQRPDALGSSFKFLSVKAVSGGLNNQTLSAAGDEANLDVQFAFGLSHPIP
ncbi:hypothetical protein H0H93_002444, partial [Arthromyces matolae]